MYAPFFLVFFFSSRGHPLVNPPLPLNSGRPAGVRLDLNGDCRVLILEFYIPDFVTLLSLHATKG